MKEKLNFKRKEIIKILNRNDLNYDLIFYLNGVLSGIDYSLSLLSESD